MLLSVGDMKIYKKYWNGENSPANMGILNGRVKCTTNKSCIYYFDYRSIWSLSVRRATGIRDSFDHGSNHPSKITFIQAPDSTLILRYHEA